MATTISRSALRTLARLSKSPAHDTAFVCRDCRGKKTLIAQSRAPFASPSRALSTTTTLHKKSSASSKSARKTPKIDNPTVNEHIPNNRATQQRDAEVDPYDHSELEAGIASATARLKDSLSKTRDAGRVTTDMLEALPVELNIKHPDQSKPKGKNESAHHERMRLGDMASVAPKGGRMMQIFAAEEGHVKPILSAVMASDYSLTPELDRNNPLLVLVPVPPATAETRAQAAQEAKKCFDKASLDVRNARGDAQKRFRRMELDKLVVQDELRKAHKGMEEVAKKGQDEIKKVYEGALKALQQ